MLLLASVVSKEDRNDANHPPSEFIGFLWFPPAAESRKRALKQPCKRVAWQARRAGARAGAGAGGGIFCFSQRPHSCGNPVTCAE